MSQGKWLRFWIFVSSVLAIVVWGGQLSRSAYAQQGSTPIAVGDTVDGTITPEQWQQQYSLEATAGESVVITSIGNGGLDTALVLQDASGAKLAEDDDSAGGGNARIKYTFDQDGTYTIISTRSGQQGGQTQGSFTL